MLQTTPTSLHMLKADHFRDKVGHRFSLEGTHGAIAITLVDVWEGPMPLFSGTDRKPFRLTFLGPPGVTTDYHVMLNLRHPKLGLVEGVFIGPVTADLKLPESFGVTRGQYWCANFN